MHMKEIPKVHVKAGYVCTMCGKPINSEDEETYIESQRCWRCHYELDTDSGPIPVLKLP
jgi:DNA-directed RNA polymerase subunit RPC12/RpoP